MGAVAALLALLVLHQGGVRGHICFALGFVIFVAPAGASVAMIRVARRRVALPSLLLRGPFVEAVAEQYFIPLASVFIVFVAPAGASVATIRGADMG